MISIFFLPSANEVWGKVMFLLACVNLFTGGLYDVTSCLVPWSHVLSRGSLSLVPCSSQRCLPDRDHPGQRAPGQRPPRTESPWTETTQDRDPLDRDTPWTQTPCGQRHSQDRDLPCMVKSRCDASYWNVFLLT